MSATEWRAPGNEHPRPPADADRQRAVAVGPAVLPRRRADADLRADAHRELRAWRALHAGRLRRLLADSLDRQLLAGARRRAGGGRAVRRGLRAHDPAPPLPARRPRLPDGDIRPRP